ncbi:MAG: hypothetical protein FWC64_06645 [Treponema sp.]|nr:hypothetical protein [Treponema sp.]
MKKASVALIALFASLAVPLIAACAGGPAADGTGPLVHIPGQPPHSPVRAEIVTGELLNEHAPHAFFDDPDYHAIFAHPDWQHGRDQRIVFAADTVVTGFRFLRLVNTGSVDDAAAFRAETLYSLDELSPGRPFVATWLALGGMPHRGISFVDASGAVRYFSVWEDTMSDYGPRLRVIELVRR